MSVAVHQPYGAFRMSPRIRHRVTEPTKEGVTHLQTILAHPRKALRGIDSTLCGEKASVRASKCNDVRTCVDA